VEQLHMCLIDVPEGPPPMVGGTRIFVGPTRQGRQITYYANYVNLQTTESEIPDLLDFAGSTKSSSPGGAMILPVPRGRIRLLDLSNKSMSSGHQYGQMLDRLDAAFPRLRYDSPYGDLGCDLLDAALFDDESQSRRILKVEEVGSYFVSVAPRLEDIDHVDPSYFKVSAGMRQTLSINYADHFSFIVCRFKTKKVEPHPVGYEHERLPDGRMFVPTRHEHGSKHQQTDAHADWDHTIYACCSSDLAFASGVKCIGGPGLTPLEEHEQLTQDAARRNKERGSDDGGRWYVEAGSVTLCYTGLDVPCKELLRRKQIDENLGHSLPNDDLVYSLARSVCSVLPAPSSPAQRDRDLAAEVTKWLSPCH